MPEVRIDPVCGMELNKENTETQAEFQGKTYYFCSDNCRNRFDQNPASYVSASDVTGPGERGASGA